MTTPTRTANKLAQATLTTTAAALYTTETFTTTQVSEIWLANTNATTARTVTLYAHGLGTSNIISTVIIPASSSAPISNARIVLNPGEILGAKVDTGTDVTLTAYGIKSDFTIPVPSLGVLAQYNRYGIRHNSVTDTITRLDSAVGLVANISPGTNNFDSIMPWAGMRRCNLADNLTVNAYYGDASYREDGSNGQVMVEVPAFYFSRVQADANNTETYISAIPLAGFKLHPWFYDANGLPRTKAYFSASEGSVYDVTASATEVNTLTVTTACSVAGNITIKLDQYNVFTIALLTTDNTNDSVALKIRNATYAGWTTSGINSDVIFTCNATGAKTTAIFGAGTTGVTATVVKTTTGAGGYVTGDAQVADFTATTGDKLSSVFGVKPCSGLTQNLVLPMSRILATNRGSGWQQQFFNAVSAIQMLLTVEYASLNSQVAIGQGVVNVTDDGATNCSVITGATASLGNKSGRAVGTDGLVSVSYRGIENFWGNIWKWVDGINISNGKVYISSVNGSFVSDTFTGNYADIGLLLPSADGYMSKAFLTYAFNQGYLPSEAVGTSSSKYADYLWRNLVGNFVAQLGGYWYYGAYAGAFCWRLSNGSADRIRAIGARLCA